MGAHLGFLLAHHDWMLEVTVKNDVYFLIAWLKEQMFDVSEENVHLLFTSDGLVAQSVRMDVQIAWVKVSKQTR